MKLYVIPIGKICNANCEFCVTKFREEKGRILDIEKLKEKIINLKNVSMVEITGGGEPLLHPKINQIIDLCSNVAPTRIYSNGSLVNAKIDLAKISELCISRAHHNQRKNFELMGVSYTDDIFYLHPNIKLSLMLLTSGINCSRDLEGYLNWANEKEVKKVVVRQLGQHNHHQYKKIFERLFVPIKKLLAECDIKTIGSENPVIKYRNLFVEFELVSCPENRKNLILNADGQVCDRWNS